MFGPDGEQLAGHPKAKTFSLETCKKSDVKLSIQKPILLNDTHREKLVLY